MTGVFVVEHQGKAPGIDPESQKGLEDEELPPVILHYDGSAEGHGENFVQPFFVHDVYYFFPVVPALHPVQGVFLKQVNP